MKKIKMEALLAALTSLLLVFSTNAQAAPCSTDSCEPCGYFAANAGNLPSSACNVNPLVNYTATAECCRRQGFFSGPYLGAAYGVGNVNSHLETAGNTPTGINSDSRSYLVTIFNGGFNLVIDYFFLGIEAGYNIRSRVNPTSYYDITDFLSTQAFGVEGPLAQVTTVPCQIRFDINSTHAATADLLPGFVFSRFVGYLRLGVERANYSADERFCFPGVLLNLDQNINNIVAVDFHTAGKFPTIGYRLGVGFGVAAGPHVSFHLNYIHTISRQLTEPVNSAPLVALTPEIVGVDVTSVINTGLLTQLGSAVSIQPQRDEVNFGVKFRF